MRATFVVWAVVLSASSVCAAEYTITRGLSFSEAGPKLTLDLFVPNNAAKPAPCILIIQGGGFAPQNSQRRKPLAERLTAEGFAAALISYRGRPAHHYQDSLADVRAAAKFLREQSSKLGIDGTRLGATGGSAGATLAALLAVTGDETDAASRIQAAACFAGVYDFVGRFNDDRQLALQPMKENKLRTNAEWIGEPFSSEGKHWRAASAVNHVDAKDPPLLLLHSRDDRVVPWHQSEAMHDALKKAGASSELKIYETGGHGVKPAGEDTFQEMVGFFRRCFLPNKP